MPEFNLEKMSPSEAQSREEMKKISKLGVQTPWDETLQEIELKAQDILPEELLTSKESGKSTKSHEDFQKEYEILSAELVTEKQVYNSLYAENEKVLGESEIIKDLVSRFHGLGDLAKFFADFSHRPKEKRRLSSLETFRHYNELIGMEVTLLKELSFQARRIIEGHS